MSDNGHSGIRRVFALNIGTIVFGILFIYILITLILYATATHVRSYQVTSGPLARNQTYTGLAVYSERLVTADSGGFVNYYARNHSRIRKGGIVYGTSPMKKQQTQMVTGSETLQEIRNDMESFAGTFSTTDFHDIYSLKYLVEGKIMGEALRNTVPDSSTTLTLGDATLSSAPVDGVVCFSTDGLEGFDYRDVSASDFDEKAYTMKSLRGGRQVSAGDPVYRIIDSENWSILIPLTAKQIVKLGNTSSVRVKFLKDGFTERSDFTILTMADGSYYGKLDFKNGMIRYLDNRFIDLELVTNTDVGLKIPISSIVSKTFFTVPEEYATHGGDSDSIGFLKAVADKSGNSSTEFIITTLYEHKGGRYYIDSTSFSKGDIILRDGSTDRFIVGDTAELEGVYNMNKGYAVFRKINIIDKNEDYCIIEKGTPYGISEFDNIVENASTVHESQITAQ
ncbi:MAG: hypothetical protein IJJ52_00610 [Lachnospiraceae bacterium]|nr:hypothetical protein [Lachnospiraceae bacterium]